MKLEHPGRQLLPSEEYEHRCTFARMMQLRFIQERLVPWCGKREIDGKLAGLLSAHLFAGIGDLLRDSLMSPEVFRDHLYAIGEDLLMRVDEYKGKTGGADWEEAVGVILNIEALPSWEIFPDDQRVVFKVPFPIRKTRLDSTCHSHIRYSPDLYSRRMEIEDSILLDELRNRIQSRVNDTCGT